MKQHTVRQGSTEWHALRSSTFNASEAAAMMGESPYMTRTELLRQKSTGVVPEVDASTQARFDAGHAAEASYRPIAEDMIGEDLYPVTGSIELDGMTLLASFDGLTIDQSRGFEHKLFNQKLAEQMASTCEVPAAYQWQLEHQLLVSGADEILFVTSDGTENRAFWQPYRSVPERRAALIAGWKQFQADLATFEPAPVQAKVVAEAVEALPAVLVDMKGSLTVEHNLAKVATALQVYVNRIPKQPSTDQDFANAADAVKRLSDFEDRLQQEEARALAQMTSVEELRRTVADIRAIARTARLQTEKLVEARKAQIRLDEVARGRAALEKHVAGLNASIGKAFMPRIQEDFAGVIKGKRTIESLTNAIDTELARAKIAADGIANGIWGNLNTLREQAAGLEFLFADTASIVLKAPDDFAALVANRVATHKAAEEKRLADERERIRKEEASRLEREQQEREAVERRQQLAAQQQEATVEVNKPTAAPMTAPAASPAVVPIRRPQVQPAKDRPADDELIKAIALHFRVHESKAIEWLMTIDFKAASDRMVASI